jgi:replicative DNA helicase
MSRDAEKGAATTARPPKLSDLRGSGSIEQDADAVIFMHRVDAADGQKNEGGADTARKIQIIVAKNRFGPQGGVNMLFFPAKMRFEMDATGEFDDAEDNTEVRADRKDRAQKPPSSDEDVF